LHRERVQEHLLNMFEIRDAVARRVARLVAGVILIVGAAQLAAWWHHGGDPALVILVRTWGLAMVGYVITRIGLWVWRPWVKTRFPVWFEVVSLAIPSMGAGLLGPLTLHIPFAIALGGVSGFEAWAHLSITMVGFTHLAFAALIAVRAYQLACGKPAMRWTKVVIVTLCVSSVPWVIVLGIPPTLVGCTGLALTPLALAMDRAAARDRGEREALAGYTDLPEAIVVHDGRAAA
jgi:hypothetical protein